MLLYNPIKEGEFMIRTLYVYKETSTDPYHNIATEKRLLEKAQPGTCILYLWQNKNTVVIGRNQNPWVECRTTMLEQDGGHLARRLSGGGAVFHDMGNLNFTFLVAEEDYDLDRQLSVIEKACSFAGITATRSGRNDILAEGCKFSGNAFYHRQGKAYHHGTLLVNVDMPNLGKYLTPSKAKLESKGVASVRSRVINLQELSPALTVPLLAEYMEKAFGAVYDGTPQKLVLDSEDQTLIAQYTNELSDWNWLYGQKTPCTFECNRRFDWGSISVQLEVVTGHIKNAQVYSDSMDWSIGETVATALKDKPFTLTAMCDAVLSTSLDAEVTRDICSMLQQQDI